LAGNYPQKPAAETTACIARSGIADVDTKRSWIASDLQRILRDRSSRSRSSLLHFDPGSPKWRGP